MEWIKTIMQHPILFYVVLIFSFRRSLKHIPAANLPTVQRWADLLVSDILYNHSHLRKVTVKIWHIRAALFNTHCMQR